MSKLGKMIINGAIFTDEYLDDHNSLVNVDFSWCPASCEFLQKETKTTTTITTIRTEREQINMLKHLELGEIVEK